MQADTQVIQGGELVSRHTLIAAVFGSFVFLVAPFTSPAGAREPRLVVDVAAGWLGKKVLRGFYEYDAQGAKKA